MGSRYGGFGSDSVGGGSSSYYGDRMSGRDGRFDCLCIFSEDTYFLPDFGRSSSGGTSDYRDSTGRKEFEEYTTGNDETVPCRTNSINIVAIILEQTQPPRHRCGRSPLQSHQRH